MTKSPAMWLRSIFIVPMGLGLAVLLLSDPSMGAPRGLTGTCKAVNSIRFGCNFPGFPGPEKNLTIQYVSMQCGNIGKTSSLQLFQIWAFPPNSNTEIGYQIPIDNHSNVGGVVSAGSSVTIYAKLPPSAFIDLYPAPAPATECTVSISADEYASQP
jgi:hypothetical protein